jgi:Fe-S cluster assembly protein SufD
MMETSLLIDAAVVTDLSKKHNEPEWLLKTRLEALENASRLPLPKTEKSNIDRWNFTRFTVAEEEAGISDLNELPEDVREYVFDAGEANVLVQKNGTVLFHQATEELKQQGVIFTDLHTAAREHEELFRKYFMTEGDVSVRSEKRGAERAGAGAVLVVRGGSWHAAAYPGCGGEP